MENDPSWAVPNVWVEKVDDNDKVEIFDTMDEAKKAEKDWKDKHKNRKTKIVEVE